MLQTSSLKPKTKITEIIKICFLLFKPISSPACLKAKRFCQNAKKIKKLKIISPIKKPIAWYKIKYQIKLDIKNIKTEEITKRVWGESFIMVFSLKQLGVL